MSNRLLWRVTGHHDEPRAFCELCKEWQPLNEIMAHLLVEHALDVDLEAWPDGGPVVFDMTMTPDDFAQP